MGAAVSTTIGVAVGIGLAVGSGAAARKVGGGVTVGVGASTGIGVAVGTGVKAAVGSSPPHAAATRASIAAKRQAKDARGLNNPTRIVIGSASESLLSPIPLSLTPGVHGFLGALNSDVIPPRSTVQIQLSH